MRKGDEVQSRRRGHPVRGEGEGREVGAEVKEREGRIRRSSTSKGSDVQRATEERTELQDLRRCLEETRTERERERMMGVNLRGFVSEPRPTGDGTRARREGRFGVSSPGREENPDQSSRL